jgi:hypothetical protein
MSVAAGELPDRAVVSKDGANKTMSVQEFLRIPLEAQVELLLKGAVTFFRGSEKLRTIEALKILRELRVQRPTPAT